MFGEGVKIGRVFGIEIGIDLSWLVIFFLVTFNLAVAVFPALHPAWSTALNWGVGLAASLLFFASVLAHEIAHSLVARAKGLTINRIVLFLFGGVSDLQEEPKSPGTELVMAIVGPLTSLVLGLVFLVLGTFLADGLTNFASAGPVPTLFLWLGPINILLGIFNLIPGFPLDGGRVLRSILWAVTGNLKQATRWSSFIGQGLGWLFIITGVAMALGVTVPLLGAGLFSGLWLVFIGWFLSTMAAHGYRQVVVEDILKNVPVGRLMREKFTIVPPTVSVDDLVNEHIMGTEDRAFPVMADGQLVGIVTLDDVRKAPRQRWRSIKVSEVMTPGAKLIEASPDEPVVSAFQKITGNDINQLPVLENGQLKGLISRRDILLWLQTHSGE